MRIAIISDVHANVDALRAVLGDAAALGARQVIGLGDLVGYNAFPRETLALLREREIMSVHGNHELMVLGWLPVDGDPQAQAAIHWTREVLTPEDRHDLVRLPAALRVQSSILCVHSAPGDPLVRLRTGGQFHARYAALQESDPAIRVCFTGHSHIPGIMVVDPRGGVTRYPGERAIRLSASAFAFVNPSSVGLPRDGDWRAAYALFDCVTRRVVFRRVTYDRFRVRRENARRGLVPQPITHPLEVHRVHTDRHLALGPG